MSEWPPEVRATYQTRKKALMMKNEAKQNDEKVQSPDHSMMIVPHQPCCQSLT